MKRNFSNLVIEVTRRCNMACAHCMRGEAQNKDLALGYVDDVLRDVGYVSSLTLTGGEPSLNVPAIRYIRDAFVKNGVDLGSLAVVTNGKAVSDEFILALMDLLILTTEPENNYLAVSNDMFHDDVSRKNVEKLKLFACFDEEGHHTDFSRIPVINEGRARTLSGAKRDNYLESFEVEDCGDGDMQVDSTVTLTVDGNLLSGCDYAYDNVDDILLGRADDPLWLEKALENMRKEECA